MPKSKSSVRIAGNVPHPKVSGIVRNTPQWKDAVRSLEQGKSIEISVPKVDSLKNTEMAFLAALRRKYRKSYKIYARNGIIYCLVKDKP